jgi:hypothetical protein
MAQQQKAPRIYTYKITFEEIRHYYYGVHKEKFYDDGYMGTPITHKWMWDFYTPEKQILEIFDYNEEGWRQALLMETELIKYFYDTDPYCLNESCSGVYSLKSRSAAGKLGGIAATDKAREEGIGFFALTKEDRSKHGKKSAETHKNNGTGFFGPEHKEMARKGGSTRGKRHKEEGTGIFSISKEERLRNCSKGGKTAGKQNSYLITEKVWMCTVTGFITTAGALTPYQCKRGIDPSNRIQIKPYSNQK